MLQDENPWPRIIGPCYTAEALARKLAIRTEEVVLAAAELKVLRVIASDGVSLFPCFQVRKGRVPDGFDVVLRVLRAGFDSPMMWAQWLASPTAPRAGKQKRRIDELRDGRIGSVFADAVDTALAWAKDLPAARLAIERQLAGYPVASPSSSCRRSRWTGADEGLVGHDPQAAD